ncbi:flagellar brake protein [Paraburkholderia lycopersici]|uniref:C-di-GMP-binding flagellar brake protein YcgR, contains PilZNR and PilZ domains n=1 Tax=Paraburkholderia lycopersici TaxID=416944 RepID=A0A1G7AHP4_9BURK|nr:flagellar brake protein [Paraburkholderia lycopersici]SDE14458.1 c-di-GMP-binding flagellar brake protein YcgR, contains PilZNR and PilZ domains [Paraburkholderia lycopersici]
MTNLTTEAEAEAAPATPDTAPLTPDAIPLGEPLAWPLVDRDGTLLLDSGSVLLGESEREFLFQYFTPHRGDVRMPDAAADLALAATASANAATSARDMHLAVGALMGLRPQMGASGAPMQPCRLIGYAPNGALFVTTPYADGRPVSITPGENVEIVAIASQAVYRFVCTVHGSCYSPLDYLVLSKPANIRRLRERRSIRVRAQFPVRYGIGEEGTAYDGVALARGISALGLSVSAAWALGKVGERLRIAFRLRSSDYDMPIETTAVIRNVQTEPGEAGQATLGLELDRLTSAEQMAMKVYVFDRQDDVLYWTGSMR